MMASPTPGQTNLGVSPNVGGLVCYLPCCIGLIFSVVAVIVEKQSKFVRFHAFQSLLFHGAQVVLWVALMVLGLILGAIHLGLLILPIQVVLGIAILGTHIFLMVKANGGEELELPVIGEMAKKWA
jgi:uncharacterized membrane protein